jgi:hypothetical protein
VIIGKVTHRVTHTIVTSTPKPRMLGAPYPTGAVSNVCHCALVSVTYTIGVSRYGRFNMVFGYLVGFHDSKKKVYWMVYLYLNTYGNPNKKVYWMVTGYVIGVSNLYH